METDLRRLTNYWKGLSSNGELPSKSLIDPKKITSLLPHIFILEVKDDNYLMRLVGSAFRDLYGMELTGKKILDFYKGDVSTHFERSLGKVLNKPCIGVLTRLATNSRGHIVYLKTLYLPCAEEAGEASFILGMTTFKRSKVTYDSPFSNEPAQGLKMPHAWFLDEGFGVPK